MEYVQRMWTRTSPAVAAGLTTLFCVFLLGFALVLEYFVELTPCPLCIAQRIFFVLIGATTFFYLWFPKLLSQKLLAIKVMALAFFGGAIAARQVWMQHHPPVVDSDGCVVSFGSFIDQFLQALGGTGDCAKVDWTFLTLSIAEWSLISFIFLFIVGVWFWQRSNTEA